jgi:hypothetical protein
MHNPYCGDHRASYLEAKLHGYIGTNVSLLANNSQDSTRIWILHFFLGENMV